MASPGALVQQIGQQSVVNGAGTSASLTITLGAAVVAGDLIVIAVYSNAGSSSAGNHSVADNGPSYTYHQDIYAFDGSFRAFNVSIFSVVATSGMAAGKAITVTAAGTNGAVYASAAALEYAGPFPASPVDQTHSNAQNVNGAPVTAATSGNTSGLAQAVELAVGAVAFVDPGGVETQTITGTNGFTGRTIAQGGSGVETGICPLDQVLDSAAGLAATGTLGNTSQAMTAIATYKLSFPPVPESLPTGQQANPMLLW